MNKLCPPLRFRMSEPDIYTQLRFNACFENTISSDAMDILENDLNITQIFISSTKNTTLKAVKCTHLNC